MADFQGSKFSIILAWGDIESFEECLETIRHVVPRLVTEIGWTEPSRSCHYANIKPQNIVKEALRVLTIFIYWSHQIKISFSLFIRSLSLFIRSLSLAIYSLSLSLISSHTLVGGNLSAEFANFSKESSIRFSLAVASSKELEK